MGGLHGIDMVSAGGGLRSITTVSTAIIGLIGTAPDAEGATPASVNLGSALLDNAFTLTAGENYPGRAGNALSVEAVAGAEAGSAITVALDKGVLVITLAVDERGEVTSTAAAVVEAISQSGTGIAARLNGNAGNGVVEPFTRQSFTGGQDEPFPVNTPWVIAGSEAHAARLGEGGTLKTAVTEILSQTGALIVGIRVSDAPTVKAGETVIGNIISGMQGFLLAQTKTGNQPRVFIAPDFSEDDGVGKALEAIAERMKGVAYLDSPSMATPQEVVARRSMYGERVEILRPRVLTTDGSGQMVYRPYSAFAAGLRARIDSELGYWWSKSNQVVKGFSGVEQPDSGLSGMKTAWRTS
ncbi:phage tail sheath subtilisin-like domain-containing protein [Enterobacter sp. JMULE2]|uniref:phage tail sheath subtilisin-like domain-containing protein n=1 Tax=Enterobacter sp. JMULE2 TaxID=2518340 RepID=UPI0020C90EFE|nr:phage tail sheath subtilisin-like domain-containing protein [Enterobacter sp. JMULE2]